ncbi:class I adenylate-forming enzyme family protein [Aeromicrobium sp. CF3.5]|uniref:class I adenylate-forming enzyme family protein n=1 Tax=Aeromicrobium sp. CF3.5 TaxID=3373078 RepID=UPI003EE4DCAD
MRLFPEVEAARFRRDGWWSGRTWTDLLDEHREGRPDHASLLDPPNRSTFLDGEPRRWTWAEVGDQVDRLSRVLFAHGVRRDVVVGVQLPNCVELPVALLAVARLGAIVTPFPVQYRRHELAGMGAAAALQVFVTAHRAMGRDMAADVAALTADVHSLRSVLAIGPGSSPGVEAIDEALAAADTDSAELTAYLEDLVRDANDCVTLVWTSGTEGVPKGVPRAYGDWEVLSRACAQAPRLTSDDVLLNPFPMVNGGGLAGMFLPWLTLGTTLAQHQPFDLDVFIGQVEDERVTYTCAPPMVLDTLVADESTFTRRDLSSLRAVGSGSAPLSGWMISRWERDHGIEVLNLFGSNEGGVLFGDPETVPEPNDRGRFFPRYGVPGMQYRTDVAHVMQARLVDLADGSEITEPGRPGELRLKGPTIFAGYWNRGRHGFDDDGWFCTGDVFEIGTDNPDFLTHVDRAKDLIIRGGFKISAAELEGLVIADALVSEVAAVAMPDDRLGERVCLFVVARDPAAPPTLEGVIDRLSAAGVAKFKWPERLELVDALPRNPIGKILKRELRTRLAPVPVPQEIS